MTRDLLDTIEGMLARCDGWCSLEKAHTLAAIVCALRPKLAVEIGVYGGRSLLAVALAMKHLGSGRIIGIDAWSKDASVAGMTEEANRNWWNGLDHDAIYRRFMDNLVMSGAVPFVEVVRADSNTVTPPPELDILHVDGSHEETAYHDTVRFGGVVRVGGIVVCDDLDWSSGAPKRGAEWMLENGFVRLYGLGTGAVFQRIAK